MASLDEAGVMRLGQSPVAGAAPCGADASDDEKYISVMNEAAKLDRIEMGEPDWHGMHGAATALLEAQTKDVEVAALLGLALFRLHGYAGLAAGLGLANDLVRNFWDGLFPPRPRRRKVCLEALADRFTEAGWFGQNPPRGDDFEALERCRERTEALKAALTERMPDDPPALDKFLRGLKEQLAKKPSETGAAAAAPAAPGAPGGAAGALVVGEVADPSSALNAIGAAVKFLRDKDTTDPAPYAVLRAARWAKVALPPEPARQQLDPPESATVQTLTDQFNNAIWERLLKNAEAAFRSNDPLWLDLQRYVCTAMQALGPAYEKARQAVIGQLAALVKRLGDGLYDLRFRNGTPLCSGETKLWIQSEVVPPTRAAGGGVGGDGKLVEASEKAQQLAGAGKVKEALEVLQEGLDGCAQRRDRFLWRLRMAQLCHDAGRPALAACLLEKCDEEMEQYGIGEWEPRLAAEVAGALYRSRKALASTDKQPAPEVLEGIRASYAKLCQLDPLAALAVEPPGR